MVDKIKPLKLEDPTDGGDELDQFPTAINPNEDFLDCRGVVLQSGTSHDEAVQVTREGDALYFKDAVAGTHTLASVVSGGFDVNNLILDVAGGIVYDNTEQVITRL